jgi:hypothetical protein
MGQRVLDNNAGKQLFEAATDFLSALAFEK